jgi:hypothetical protein
MIHIKNLEDKRANAQSIQMALSNHFIDHKYKIFNSYLFDWESDYLSVNESFYVYECEIKITMNDFKKDFKKKSKHTLFESLSEPNKIPNKFYYTCPRGLLPSYKIPTYAGLIEVNDSDSGYRLEVIKKAPFLHRENVFDSIKPALLDKFYHKYIRTELENYELQNDIKKLQEENKNLKEYVKKI